MNPPEGSPAWAAALLGPELTARAYALSDSEPCQPGPEQLERLRQIFTRPVRHGHQHGEHVA
jgi:hypothetical protein